MNARTSRRSVVAVVATLLISSSVFAVSVHADPASESRDGGHRVVLTLTKWVTIDPGPPIMEGVVGGDVVGKFAGQVLVDQTSDLVAKLGPLASGDIEHLEAVYNIVAGEHSFRAFVQGGGDILTNRGRLDGVVLGGWLTGSKVHVGLTTIKCSQPNALGGNCFQGTITLTPDPEN
jgi:hypothetical protein